MAGVASLLEIYVQKKKENICLILPINLIRLTEPPFVILDQDIPCIPFSPSGALF